MKTPKPKPDVMLALTDVETENVTVFTRYLDYEGRWKTTISLSKHVLEEFVDRPRTAALGLAYSSTEDEAKIMHERCLADVYRGGWQEDVRMMLAGLEPVRSEYVELW